MAERALLQSYLNCNVCSETFTDPVSLSCNHSFCSSCLQKFWEQSENINCPICKRKSFIDDPHVNLTLKELVDSFLKLHNHGSPETVEKQQEQEVMCEKHREVPYWFCEDEQTAVCPVCEFSLHQSHKVVPLDQAVSELKELLKADLRYLQDKRNQHRGIEETYNEMIQHSKQQLSSTEKQIRAEFNKLHEFLREEEESRLAALRKEEEQKRRTISRQVKMIKEQISSLSDSIQAVEEELQKHSVPFIGSYKATQSRTRVQCALSDPHLLPGALLDVAKHLGNLSFRVWEKMKDQVRFSPVILDPNTANCRLYLSDDLTSVKHGNTDQQLPDNPERHTKYSRVLGSEGFSSGKHSWDVEVGDYPNWFSGFTKESNDRKKYTSDETTYGIKFENGNYTDGRGQKLNVRNLQRIRVQLDYDGAEVSFYDPEDMTHIFTHRDIFTGKLFPFLGVGNAYWAETAVIRICQSL